MSCHRGRVASERTEPANARRSPQGIPGVLPRAATPQWRAPFAPDGRVPLGLWPRCAPWQWDAPFPAGRASPQTKGDALMRLYPCDTALCRVTGVESHQSERSPPMQGAARREYRAYCQGLQRRSGALRSLPKGASPLACGRVAPLGNGTHHSLRVAPRHRPRGTR